MVCTSAVGWSVPLLLDGLYLCCWMVCTSAVGWSVYGLYLCSYVENLLQATHLPSMKCGSVLLVALVTSVSFQSRPTCIDGPKPLFQTSGVAAGVIH